jgi:hypothetical protein
MPAGIANRGVLTRNLRLFEGGTQRGGHAIADAGPRSPESTQLYVLEFVAGIRRSVIAAGRREAQSRTTGAGRARRRGTQVQNRTWAGDGTATRRYLPAFEAWAGPTPCYTLAGRRTGTPRGGRRNAP